MQEMQKKYETENPHLCKICAKRFPTQVFMYRYPYTSIWVMKVIMALKDLVFRFSDKFFKQQNLLHTNQKHKCPTPCFLTYHSYGYKLQLTCTDVIHVDVSYLIVLTVPAN
jgi:hypothetical protein